MKQAGGNDQGEGNENVVGWGAPRWATKENSWEGNSLEAAN